jgi:hypothetical protein
VESVPESATQTAPFLITVTHPLNYSKAAEQKAAFFVPEF